MTKLLEVPREETEVGAREQPEDQVRPELHPAPDLDIPIIPEDSEVIAEREGVHERIQADIQHEDKEAEVADAVMLEVPLEWNGVPDLIMEDDKGLMIMETDTKPKRDEETHTKQKKDEVAQGRRKQRKEDDIHLEKGERYFL